MNYRKIALNNIFNRDKTELKNNSNAIFGEYVFDYFNMKIYLSEEKFKKLNEMIDKGIKLDNDIAEEIAAAMKKWALSWGATHYTHWFQPLNGLTAEKHDAFLSLENGQAIEHFTGEQLIQQEPDASSFPSGGIRNTFEARGYTAWDPTSPAFLYHHTLCIPTIFVSYTGESLDFKTPLKKSISALNKAAVDVCKYFDESVTKVVSTLGLEQEYFLVDESLYYARPDLMVANRTLFGHASAKDQQMEDHYFGSIPTRVSNYMKEFENEAWKLGIPVKTRHNEVAPNQYELAPIYEEVNLAIDHNQLLMDLMESIAKKHHFRVLFNEKPYAGINGSGKHNNWSMATNTGKNLLKPGKTPIKNIQFLTFFINVIKAVKENSELLRASVANAGNEYRLGANEAPPAIISAFIGEQLTKVFDMIENDYISIITDNKTEINVDNIPEIKFDKTDRNRTSPFAFTGDKFELRMVGASSNCSPPMIVLNTIVANQLTEFKKEVDSLIRDGFDKNLAIMDVLKNYIKSSRDILFEGNGYSEEWLAEAKRRGLPNIKDTPTALEAYLLPKTKKVFEDMNVLSERELESRYHIKQETYVKALQIEARVIGDMALNHIIPTAIKYQNELIKSYNGIDKIWRDMGKSYITTIDSELENYQFKTIREISRRINKISYYVEQLVEARKIANVIEEPAEKAKEYCNNVKPWFEKIRNHADKLEMIIDDELWTLPKYREMLLIN